MRLFILALLAGCSAAPLTVEKSVAAAFTVRVDCVGAWAPAAPTTAVTRDDAENWILDQVSQLDTWAADGEDRAATAMKLLAPWQGDFVNFGFTAPEETTAVFEIQAR